MANRIHRLNPLSQGDAAIDPAPWHHSLRAKIFSVTAAVVLLAGLGYTLLQPVIYRSSATVLMSAPRAIDAEAAEADTQNVAIQRRLLLGTGITGRTRDELADSAGLELQPEQLQAMLRVDPVPDTNLVEMAAVGTEREQLPVVVGTWIAVYLAARAEDIAESKARTTQKVQDELDGLAAKLAEAREALEAFRAEHNIISAERQENEVLARLDGLNRALNNAIEEEVKAQARVESLRSAAARGEPVVPAGEQRSLNSLQAELQELQGRMAEMERRYTPEYMSKQPSILAMIERIEALEAQLAVQLDQWQRAGLAEAEQASAAASQTVRELEQKLAEHKAAVAEFSNLFATHEALVSDLERLEELNREAQARLVQVEVRRVERYPQVAVIDPPASVATRVGPNYLLLTGATLASALGLGVLAVWLYGFLGHKTENPAYVTLSGVHMYPPDSAGALPAGQVDPRLPAARAGLPGAPPPDADAPPPAQDAPTDPVDDVDKPAGGATPGDDKPA
jgi:uncharacterized protein involved in exopolysaccharide biosynthesis